MIKPPTFAIAGLGNISSRHTQAIKDIGGKIIDTYDVDRSRSSTVHSWEDFLKTKADWIVLLTPNKMHLQQALAALKTNKNVIVEKPPTMTYFELFDYPLDAPIYTISQLRYMESIKKLRIKVLKDSGYSVKLNVVAHRDPIYLANWRGKEDWSGGLLYIIGIHYFDILTWIFGGVKTVDYVRWINEWKCQGKVQLDKCELIFNIEISEDKPNSKSLIVDDKEIDLAAEFFELHGECYKDIMNGGGIHPWELNKAILLIDKLHGKSI